MKKITRVEAILNSYGWKTVSGHAEYKGFEHLLNPDLPDWTKTELMEDDPIVAPVVLEVDPHAAEAFKKNQATHSELMAALKRVEALKERVKAKAK